MSCTLFASAVLMAVFHFLMNTFWSAGLCAFSESVFLSYYVPCLSGLSKINVIAALVSGTKVCVLRNPP